MLCVAVVSAGVGGKPRQFGARTYNNRFKSRAGRAGTKTCRLLRIIAYMFLPLKRGVNSQGYIWKNQVFLGILYIAD